MVLNERPSKRVKRRVTADLYDFLTFPSAGDLCCNSEPFRSGVQRFLSHHARVTFPPSIFPSLVTWQITFRVGDLVDGPDLSPATVTLDIVEEDVTRSRRPVYCDQCRVVGWSGHPVCRKRYHFMIRSESNNTEGYQKPCSKCGSPLLLAESRCKWCHCYVTSDDVEDWVYPQLEDSSHLLHGVVHSNGYGHLLTLNGREGGSTLLSGSDIINFWDRLCTKLRVRKVSVMDVSKKFGLEYRLLHAVTNGHSWYGNWGYEFGTGSYALTKDAYQEAANGLSGIPLSSFLFRGRGLMNHLQCVIALYQSLSDTELLTIKDLFSFLLRLIQESRKPLTSKIYSKAESVNACNILCPWTRDDVERVQQTLIRVLVAAAADDEARWVTRRALKGAVCKAVPSTELLDYSLKHLGGKVWADGMVVHSRCNSNSTAVEYRLVPLCIQSGNKSDSTYPSEGQLISDLKFLYDSILDPERIENYGNDLMRKQVTDSARKLLDCKKFMKHYKPEKIAAKQSEVIRVWCYAEHSEPSKDGPTPPPELIVLPSTSTVADLKTEAKNAFQEVYLIYKKYEVEQLPEYGPVEDAFTLKLLVGTSGSVRIRGKCPGKHGLNRFRMERGIENWVVDCTCGAKDDDGERMLACDTCSVWQHTRCAGIDNSDEIPSKFVCKKCLSTFRDESKREPNRDEYKMGTKPSEQKAEEEVCALSTCRVQVAASDKNEATSNMHSVVQFSFV